MKQHLFLSIIYLCFSSASLVAQHTVSGKVFGPGNAVLPGAAIKVKGADKGAVSSIDGAYAITGLTGSELLVVSLIGYRTVEVSIGSRPVIDIVLQELETEIDQVVVTGYTEISAKKRVASVAVLNSAQLQNTSFTDVNKLLQGNATGVYSSAISGQPGSVSFVRIRGAGSISAGREPLYVVDGVIALSGNGAQLDDGFYTQSEMLALLNPNDIESITVLKDAAATAMYGARGSNGVVVITTKQGAVGKTTVTVRSQAGLTMPSLGNLKLMAAEQQWNYDREVLANSGFSQGKIDSMRPASMLDNTTDWVHEAFSNGVTRNLEVQTQGGNEKTRFFASGGWFDQEGTVFGTRFNRLSLRSNIAHIASDRLSFSLNLNGSYSEQNLTVDGFNPKSLVLQALTATPLQRKINPATGELYTGLESNWIANQKDNFLYSQPLNPFQSKIFRLLSKMSATYRFTDHLSFMQIANVDWVSMDEKDFDDPTTRDGKTFNGYLANAYDNYKTLTTQSHLKYSNQFGAYHNLDAVGIVEWQRYRGKRFLAVGKGFASGKLQTLNSAADLVDVGGSESQFAFLSFLAQANYAFRDRYVLSASLRRDGSSRFGAARRWANFWSIGASWHLTEESFLKNLTPLDNLRLRASYGTSGNAEIGDYSSLELYNFGENYLNQSGSGPTQISNPDLSWEKSGSLNIGLDFALLNRRIGGSVEWYRRITNDLLLYTPVSATTGFTSALRNVGKMRNSGIEATLNLVPFKSSKPGGFAWSIDFNISFNDNKILQLPNHADIIGSPPNFIWREGYPLYSLYMRKWAGVNPDDGSPLWYTADGGTTGNISQAPAFIVGNAEPDFIAGLATTVVAKGFSLSALFYTAQGQSKMDYSTSAMDNDGVTFGYHHLAAASDYWKQPGDDAPRPRPSLSGNKNASAPSTRYLEDGSFIRLRNVVLSYQFPSAWLGKMKLQGVTLYVQGQNLWTHTHYSRLDPEGVDLGLETYRYPPGKALSAGLDVTF